MEVFYRGAGCRELDRSSSIQHKIGPFKRLIPVVRHVQVHVYSCTQHRNWYTSDREVPYSRMYTVGVMFVPSSKKCVNCFLLLEMLLGSGQRCGR
jgi:hypothetical protein